MYTHIHAYIQYIYVLEFDLSLYRDRVCWNPKVKWKSSRVSTIRKFRHYVGIRWWTVKFQKLSRTGRSSLKQAGGSGRTVVYGSRAGQAAEQARQLSKQGSRAGQAAAHTGS